MLCSFDLIYSLKGKYSPELRVGIGNYYLPGDKQYFTLMRNVFFLKCKLQNLSWHSTLLDKKLQNPNWISTIKVIGLVTVIVANCKSKINVFFFWMLPALFHFVKSCLCHDSAWLGFLKLEKHDSTYYIRLFLWNTRLRMWVNKMVFLIIVRHFVDYNPADLCLRRFFTSYSQKTPEK